jgi:glycosyltransferase involved in cell wall biosynthesis
MKFSIITVSYDASHTIRSTIESVLSQQIEEVEYIIIDGLSKDGTIEIIRQFQDKITHWISEPDNGIYDAMNKGLSLATGDVIGILNADDFYSRPDVLDRVQQCFTQFPDIDGVYGDLVYVDQDDSNKVIRTWRSGGFSHLNFFYGWMPPHPTVFFKREVYQSVGSFNTNFRTAADYEFLLRACIKFEKRLHYIPEILVHMRAGGMSNASLKNRIKANSEDRLAWKVNGLKGSLIATLLKPLRKIGQLFIH